MSKKTTTTKPVKPRSARPAKRHAADPSMTAPAETDADATTKPAPDLPGQTKMEWHGSGWGPKRQKGGDDGTRTDPQTQ